MRINEIGRCIICKMRSSLATCTNTDRKIEEKKKINRIDKGKSVSNSVESLLSVAMD